MAKRKETYVNAANKKAVRDFLFSYFRFNSVVGLAGPDINDYLDFCKSRGFNDIEVWENKSDVMIKQLSEAKAPVRYKFGNILEADLNKDVFYDLDYCVTVRHMKEHIQKFRDNFIMTFSIRVSIEETIEKFFGFRGESVISQRNIEGPGVRNILFQTNLGKYLFITYHDTSAMCCFAKIK